MHKPRVILLLVLILILFFSLFSYSFADVVILKDGRNVEGIIVSQDESSVQVDIGSGVVTFEKNDIDSIRISDFQEASLIRKKWKDSKLVREAIRESKITQGNTKENKDEDKKYGN